MIDRTQSQDTRIAYGARCTWWDGIENVGSRGGLPCCPHCKGMLFELPTPKDWWDGVDSYQAAGHTGYHAFMEWLKGKCFPNIGVAKAAYEAKAGRTVTV